MICLQKAKVLSAMPDTITSNTFLRGVVFPLELTGLHRFGRHSQVTSQEGYMQFIDSTLHNKLGGMQSSNLVYYLRNKGNPETLSDLSFAPHMLITCCCRVQDLNDISMFHTQGITSK